LAQFEPKQKGALLLRFFQNLALVRGTFWPKLVAHFEPFYPFIPQIQSHSSVDTIYPLMVPHKIQLPQPMIHHPEAPCTMELSQL